MRPVIDSPGVSSQLVVPRQLDRAVTADIHSLIAQSGMHARVPMGSIRRLKMRPDAGKEHHVVQLYQRSLLLTHMMAQNRSPTRRVPKGDAGASAAGRNDVRRAIFGSPEAGFLRVLDVVAIALWYPHHGANRA